MFEGVQRDDHVGPRSTVPGLCEGAAVRDIMATSKLGRFVQPFLSEVEADHVPSAAFGHFDDFDTGAATEVDHGFPSDLVPDGWAEENFHLASVLIRAGNPLRETTLAIRAQPRQHAGR